MLQYSWSFYFILLTALQVLLALCNAGKIKKVSRCKEILESKNKAFNEFDINECLEFEGILSLKLLNFF